MQDNIPRAPDSFNPPEFFAFMALGPWGNYKFNLPVCTLITGDALGCDNLKGSNRNSQRKDAEKVFDASRKNDSERGLTALQQADIFSKKRSLDIDEELNNQNRLI
jgi:hypothetical protein